MMTMLIMVHRQIDGKNRLTDETRERVVMDRSMEEWVQG